MCTVNALSSRLAPGRTGVAVVIVSAGRLRLAHNKEADCRLVRRINRSADPPRPSTAMDRGPPLLEARSIVKRFGALLANDVAEFSVRAGEVVPPRQNGAGKSTLAKILYGYYAADAGDILVNGERVAISPPSDCRALGVA